LAQVSTLGWIRFLMMLVGIGEPLKILVIAKAAFVPVVTARYIGAWAPPAASCRFANASFTAGPAPLKKANSIFTEGRSEYFMTIGPGIGGLIIAGRERFQMDLVILGIMILGLVGFAINLGTSIIEARLLYWQPK
jgi:sulfonate transport system permease protein